MEVGGKIDESMTYQNSPSSLRVWAQNYLLTHILAIICCIVRDEGSPGGNAETKIFFLEMIADGEIKFVERLAIPR